MTHALTIARRDLAERTSVFIAAAVLAVLPFVFAAIPAIRGSWSFGTVVATAGGFLVIGFTLGLALILGVTMIGRDLSEKRMSFYFSKPVSAPAIWTGKLAAAFLTVAICFAILFLPLYLFTWREWMGSWNVELSLFLGLAAILSLVMILGGHAVGTMFRSHSPLIALDVVCLAVSLLLSAAIAQSLLHGFAMSLMLRLAGVVFAALVLVLLCSGGWQLAHGRVDRRRNHLELSRFVWSAVAIVLLLAGAFAVWVTHPSPGEIITRRAVVQQANGPWALISGTARHRADYQATFLYDAASGEAIRVHGVTPWWGTPFTRDGSKAAYVQLISPARSMDGELMLVPARAGAAPVDTGLQLGGWDAYTFNDDGSRVAVLAANGNVLVYDVAAKKTIAAAHLDVPRQAERRAFFASPSVLRVYIISSGAGRRRENDRSVDAYDFDLAARRVTHTGTYTMRAGSLRMSVSADGTRAVISSDTSAAVVDARTLQPRFTIPQASQAVLLANSDVAATIDRRTLRIYAADGTLRRELPAGDRVFIADELQGNRLVLFGRDGEERVTKVVDLASGAIVRRDKDVHPAGSAMTEWAAVDPRHAVSDPRQVMVAYDGGDKLCVWEPLTGATRALFR
jgi:ABC-type transport system involved in multi-copper enzyme maturation permease subunit